MDRDFLVALVLAAAALVPAGVAPAAAATADADGTVHVPAFVLPLPPDMSAEAKATWQAKMRRAAEDAAKSGQASAPAPAIAEVRRAFAAAIARPLERTRALYPVETAATTVAGVHAVTVTPKAGIAAENRGRVLIDLHGGGFMVGDAATMGVMESAPVAALMRIEVISLDYRQGPEHHFPAASEDVVKVYRALLKKYPATAIGIYGSSAGGLLSAQAVAMLQAEHLPLPGAVGILAASADARWMGDSFFSVPPVIGLPVRDPKNLAADYDERAYYADADMDSPLMSPVRSPKLLAAFPPTFIATGTRSEDLGTAVTTHRLLVNAGVDAELHVWDGMWHDFFIENPDMPEAREVQTRLAAFFSRHLGKGNGQSDLTLGENE